MMLRELWLRLTFPVRQRRYARELEDEMALHLSLRAEQLQRTGLSADAAAAKARRQFGNRTRVFGAAREAWGWHWLEDTVQDLRYLGRQLRRAPGFAVVACLTIAFGIGLNATAFTFYDAIVLKPLPVAEPGAIVRVVQQERGFGSELLPFQAYEVLDTHARTMRSIVAQTSPQSLSVILPGHDRGDARIAVARFVSPRFAPALGIHASLGRWFDAGDDGVVVLDHAFWTRALDADPRVMGRRLRVGSADLTIVGVAAADFAGTGLPAAAPDLWIPLDALPMLMPTAAMRTDGRPHWQLLGRLAPGASLAQASAEAASLGASIPDTAGKPLRLVAKHATFFQSDAGEFEVFQQASAAFMVALALILAIAAVNLVNLFVARNAAREREVTVRLALGASRARIARQLASESVTLAVVGGVMGLVAARVLASWIRAWLVGTMASVTGGLADIFLDVALDWRVAVYAALLSIGIGLAVGLWPALRAARADAGAVLRQGTTSTSGAGLWGQRNVLLAVQVASSLVLLTAAGMLLAGMRNSRAVEPGFDADHLLVVFVDDETSGARPVVRLAELERRLAALPEVAAVAWSRRVPFAGTHLRRASTATGPITISIDDVSDTYFDALGVPVVRGRAFTRREVESNAPVMLVSESLARLRWPTGDAVGRSVPANDLLGGPDTATAYTVIGIVRDLRSNFLSRVNGPSVYYPYGLGRGSGAFLVRTHGAPASALRVARAAIAEVSPTLNDRALVVTMQGGPMSLQRLMADAPATLALVLAVAGLVLASIGVYGLISQIVTRRTREIGVHLALGARGLQIVLLVGRKTLRPVAWGALSGGVGALALSFVLRTLIAMPDVPDLTFGAGAFNPRVFLAVLGALALVVVAACYFPARRAAAVDPSVALRAD